MRDTTRTVVTKKILAGVYDVDFINLKDENLTIQRKTSEYPVLPDEKLVKEIESNYNVKVIRLSLQEETKRLFQCKMPLLPYFNQSNKTVCFDESTSETEN